MKTVPAGLEVTVMAPVTVKMVWAVFVVGVAESEKITVCGPVREVGTINVEPENDPVASVLVVPLRVREDPPNVAVNTEFAANPAPETVSEVPTSPRVGLRAIDEPIVKAADAAFELASVITTVFTPAVEVGTVKVAPVNDPVAPVLVVPLRVTAAVLKVAVIDLEPPNPVPETATVEPALPVVGFRVITGTTVNVAAAAFVLASVAVTVWSPAIEAGTVNVQLIVPKFVVVTVVGEVVCVVTSYLSVIVLVAA